VKRQKNSLGKLGENESILYLQELGFKILEKNFFHKYFEIDIIAEKNNIIYFIEVKTRSSTVFGNGYDSISNRKIEKIKKGAEYYIHTQSRDIEVQLWGIFITISGGIKRLEFIRII